MYDYDLVHLGQKTTELGFVRDTLEKVYRLADVLEYINTDPLLKESLALKGGTAINLTIFNLPRLSVDIDLDYLITDSGLLNRAAARDLYDVANRIHYGLFDESEEDLLRECVVFYAAVSARNINKTFDTGALDQPWRSGRCK